VAVGMVQAPVTFLEALFGRGVFVEVFDTFDIN
jgi:hypothetical protein